MPVRPLRRSASFSIPERRTASERCMKALPPWTGWSRSRSAASRLRPPPRPAPGATFASTLLILPATLISPPKSSVRCACSMAQSRCLTRFTACSRSRKKSGARPISTASHAFASLIRSTRWVPISSMPSIPSASASTPSPSRFRFPSDRKPSLSASST